MNKLYDYFINKVFTVPYIDKMISGKKDKDIFFKCVSRYVKENENITYGEAISQIYHYMDHSYRNEYFFKNTSYFTISSVLTLAFCPKVILFN